MAETPWTAIAIFAVVVVALFALIKWAKMTAPSDAETGMLPYNHESKKAIESRKTSDDVPEKIRYV